MTIKYKTLYMLCLATVAFTLSACSSAPHLPNDVKSSEPWLPISANYKKTN
jgi:starvation-inducible outer membrane lipoprotein